MKYHIIDVFTDKLFGGNPAGVCLLEGWLPEEVLQSIAAENNVSETAFLVKAQEHSGEAPYELRWFTPAMEIELCGHATLASAFVLFEEAEKAADAIQFKTLSGVLTVTKREGGLFCLELPSRPVVACPAYAAIEKAFGLNPVAVYKAVDFLVLLDGEETLRNLSPDFAALKQLKTEAQMPSDGFGVIVTAQGSDCDFVSRFFAPNAGVNEDPVTGRAHCSLTPFWSERLSKARLFARQLSKRGGELWCEEAGERVKISGHALRYLRGDIEIKA